MDLDEIHRLLDPAPLALETGFERLADGVLHVACRTDMRGCTGEMLEWWFRFRPTTQQYIWWHPVDHRFSEWLEGHEGTHIGSIHRVEESFCGGDPRRLLIQFRAPEEHFDATTLAAARLERRVSAVLCGRGGESWDAPRDAQGRVLGSRLFHVARDTDWGLVLRSHFFLAADLARLGRSADEITALIPDDVGPALLGHCYNEFSFLARFLPSLFVAENRATHPVALPW